MLAARILSYGNDYPVDLETGTEIVDLGQFEAKKLDESLYSKGQNEFTFNLPSTGNVITFKLLTHGDERKIDQEVKGMLKINKDNLTEATTRLKHIITSVNGEREQKDIREFVDNYLLAKDARAIREEYSKVSPDVDFTFTFTNAQGVEQEATLPITLNFFWPDF